MMYWLEVSLQTDGEGAEAAAEALRPFAYQKSVVLEQLGDATTADPDALEPAVAVKIYVPEERDTPGLRRRIEEVVYHLGRLYPLPEPIFRELREDDWANAWKAHYHPFRVGRRLVIRPTWIAESDLEDARPDDIVLALDPGMAFGTGLHPTTQGCLQALERLARPGMTVLDVGAGSGILSIAAARLGAVRVAGFDTDEVAVRAATENARYNGVERALTLWQGDLDTVAEQTGVVAWDIVVVNILAPVIIGLLDDKNLMGYVAPQGHLVLSGIIDEQAGDVRAAVGRAGGRVLQTLTAGDWVTFIVGRAG